MKARILKIGGGVWRSRSGSAGAARAADCEITVGLVMELTGPAGDYGQAGAKSVEMAFRDINDAGGAARLQARHRHARRAEPGHVAVDVATQLVQLKKVPVIIGGIISSVSIPILTSVTGPGKIVQVSPASSSPTLTDARPRRQDQRHVLPHHHLGRAAGHGGGEIRARPGLQEDRHHPRQQRLRRQHGERVRQGLQGARRQDRLGHALQREAVELRRRGDRGDGRASPTASISSLLRSTARRSPAPGSRRAARRSSCSTTA